MGQTNISDFHFLSFLGFLPYIVSQTKSNKHVKLNFDDKDLALFCVVSLMVVFVVANLLQSSHLFLRNEKLSGTGVLFYSSFALFPLVCHLEKLKLRQHILILIFLLCLMLLGGRITFMVFALPYCLIVAKTMPILGLSAMLSMGAIGFSIYFLRDGWTFEEILRLMKVANVLSDRTPFYSNTVCTSEPNFLKHLSYPFTWLFTEGDVIKYSKLINLDLFGRDHGVHLGVPYGLFLAANCKMMPAVLGSSALIIFALFWLKYVSNYLSSYSLIVIMILFGFGFSQSVFKLKFSILMMISGFLWVVTLKLFQRANS